MGWGQCVDGLSQSQQQGGGGVYSSFITERRAVRSKFTPSSSGRVRCGGRRCDAHTQTHNMSVAQRDPHFITQTQNKKKDKQIKQESRWAGGRSSGQVAVRVLLAIHSLQVLLLNQDVDAFLSTRGRQEPEENLHQSDVL